MALCNQTAHRGIFQCEGRSSFFLRASENAAGRGLLHRQEMCLLNTRGKVYASPGSLYAHTMIQASSLHPQSSTRTSRSKSQEPNIDPCMPQRKVNQVISIPSAALRSWLPCTILCRCYAQGYCKIGPNCRFSDDRNPRGLFGSTWTRPISVLY